MDMVCSYIAIFHYKKYFSCNSSFMEKNIMLFQDFNIRQYILYVVDSNGNIMGEPLMGGINYPGMLELLQVQISAALGEDVIPYGDASGSPQN